MSEWKAKRFWKEAGVVEEDEGFGVRLDGRVVRTPAKATLIVPTRALAEAIAAEWDAQDGKIDPNTMPCTRSANAALDKVAPQRDEVVEMLAAYGDSDLICYRAASPEELIKKQAEAWDPLLDWTESVLSVKLLPVVGVVHVPQDAQAISLLKAHVEALDTWALTAFHDLVSMSGSLVIGFAALDDLYPADALWDLSRVDETWQAEQWGKDEEAEEMAARKQSDFLHAKRFYDLSRKDRAI
ncbi:ATP12 family protein [Roseovarius sp. BRH_c41]|uniref:ATP12 family chaperone protein n=1 Tax=Roseovarius sp. BRH_c41 TaxID=1629709 RepID=UPI0005F0DF7E|nr:ATP12 family protein [Roseovarius sp. BRH_c41]KJS42851.1 MAG: ATPase [Roseovarius sp. BRH_c41]